MIRTFQMHSGQKFSDIFGTSCVRRRIETRPQVVRKHLKDTYPHHRDPGEVLSRPGGLLP